MSGEHASATLPTSRSPRCPRHSRATRIDLFCLLVNWVFLVNQCQALKQILPCWIEPTEVRSTSSNGLQRLREPGCSFVQVRARHVGDLVSVQCAVIWKAWEQCIEASRKTASMHETMNSHPTPAKTWTHAGQKSGPWIFSASMSSVVEMSGNTPRLLWFVHKQRAERPLAFWQSYSQCPFCQPEC